jgi:bacteriocin biosynthesis cyclodehydratase domain-containing protein
VILKLDPRFPLLWRTPASLQFGVDAPPVVLSAVTNPDERMIAALVGGVSRSGLSAIGTSAGAEEAEVSRLLDAVTPALLPASSAPGMAGNAVALTGTGPTAEGIAALLRNHGIRVRVDDTGGRRPDLAIIVAQFVIEPELHGLWLRRDVPHLAVVFGDIEVRIGPMIEPGTGPCLHCLERQRTDADPAWPAIASQLWGRSSPAETALASREAAAIATRLAVARLGGSESIAELLPAATSLHLDADSGRISRRSWRPHPECACLALPGNDWADAHRGQSRSPRKDAAVAVPA